MSDKETTTAIEVAMRSKFCAPEWALMFGVGNATGFGCSGWADAIAMSLWPSRGLALHGFEFKASRADWLRELKKPAKAEKIAKYCDYWFLVCPPKIYDPAEVPLNWGVMELTGRGLVAKVPATRLTPEPTDRAFLAAILRRLSEADESVVKALVAKEAATLRADFDKRLARQRESDARKLDELEKKLAEIKTATGIDLKDYTPTSQIAQAIKLANSIGYCGLAGAAGYLATSAEQFAAQIREALPAVSAEEAA